MSHLIFLDVIMDHPYEPISCSIHDEFLALASLRRSCELTVLLANGREETVSGVIADVYSREGAEYLQLRDGPTFRLDQIRALNGKPLV
jgi:Rho-binding antiterminator